MRRLHRYTSKTWLLAVVITAVLLFFGSFDTVYGQGGAEKAELEKLKQRIAEHRKGIDEAAGEMRLAFAQVDEIDKHIDEIEKTLAEILTEIVEAKARMAVIERDLDRAETELAARQADLARHLRLIYKYGRYPMVQILVSAEDAADLNRRLIYLARIAEEDRRLGRAIERKKAEIQKSKDELSAELESLEELKEMTLSEKDVLERRRVQKRGVISGIKKKKSALEARLKEMLQEKAALEAKIKKLTGVGAGPVRHTRDPLKEHGKVNGPTKGTVIREFGRVHDSRYGTVTINDGIDIRAPLGRDVKSIMDGEIIFADWFRGYGKTIIVDHGYGYTSVYAHCQDIIVAVGERVSEMQVIGTVGDTGYCDEAMLHFEIRRDGQAINPGNWVAFE
ncbi:MAG: peptidoglycan DD-metalloendopeptidase family protein [Candidatus Coatesbacteria bacterium]|nr:MAG: peptidoglycan DD-metalloendopeptidase family protein [Candidatus Coatesbacteria bacterium]